MLLAIPPENIRKPKTFPNFSGGIEEGILLLMTSPTSLQTKQGSLDFLVKLEHNEL